MGNSIKIKIAAPFLLAMAALFAVKMIDLKLSLTPSEMRIREYVQEDVLFQKKNGRQAIIADNLKSPIEISSGPGKEYPPVPLNEIAPQHGQTEAVSSEFKVSMIIISNKSRMAIVNGEVVGEESVIEKKIVKKIEKDRVLIAGHGLKDNKFSSTWFMLEEAKK